MPRRKMKEKPPEENLEDILKDISQRVENKLGHFGEKELEDLVKNVIGPTVESVKVSDKILESREAAQQLAQLLDKFTKTRRGDPLSKWIKGAEA